MPGATGTRYSTNSPASRSPRKTFRSASFTSSTFRRQERREIRGRLSDRLLRDLHRVAPPAHDVVAFPPLRVGLRVVGAAVRAAAFGPDERRPRHGLGHRQHRAEVAREVPPGVEEPRALHADARRALRELPDLLESLLQVLRVAEDADQVLHRLRQVSVDRVGAFSLGPLEEGETLADCFLAL